MKLKAFVMLKIVKFVMHHGNVVILLVTDDGLRQYPEKPHKIIVFINFEVRFLHTNPRANTEK